MLNPERVTGYLYPTEAINLAATMVDRGAHLQSTEADPEVSPPRCLFHLLWTEDLWCALDSVGVRDEVVDLLSRAAALLQDSGDSERAADVGAILEGMALVDSVDDTSVAAGFAALWRAGKLRVEPRQFDKSRRVIVNGMQAAQSAARREPRNG